MGLINSGVATAYQTTLLCKTSHQMGLGPGEGRQNLLDTQTVLPVDVLTLGVSSVVVVWSVHYYYWVQLASLS